MAATDSECLETPECRSCAPLEVNCLTCDHLLELPLCALATALCPECRTLFAPVFPVAR